MNQLGTASVTVVIPVYRAAGTIGRAVASVAAQSVRAETVILIDDASGDGTAAELERLADYYPRGWIQVVRMARNRGPSAARNAGWYRAKTEYVAFLDADDVWHPDKLAVQIAYLDQHGDVDLCGHLTRNVPTECVTWDSPPDDLTALAKPVSPASLLYRNRFLTRTVVVRNAVSERFDETLRRSEDYDLWMRILLGGRRGSVLPFPLAAAFKADYGEGGLTASVTRMQFAELAAYRRVFLAHPQAPWRMATVYGFSLIRFVRRLLLVTVRRARLLLGR